MLKDKHIVLGVTGGIAAYKSIELASRLRKAGAIVHVIMTEGAQNFVTELTFREVTGQPVITTMWGKVTHYNVEHVALARMADLIIIAPCTANLMAKAANGMADDMLTTTLLATRAPIFFAPAMNSNMYTNPLTQANVNKLCSLGWHLIPPASGHLACGVDGIGRMQEAVEIFGELEKYFSDKATVNDSCVITASDTDGGADSNITKSYGGHRGTREQILAATDYIEAHTVKAVPDNAFKPDMRGLKLIVTAAGTREPIDPVRYIGNRSSGKMGYAIAEAAVRRGADVLLISGPSALPRPEGLRFIGVEAASKMREEVLKAYPETDIVIKAAAVADYRVRDVSAEKIKKNDEELTLVLEKNPDILKELGEKKQPGQTLVGFAAETQKLIQYAKGKLEKKNLDFIVANDVSKPNAGFNTDTNLIKILSRDGSIEELPLLPKKALADIILDRVMASRG